MNATEVYSASETVDVDHFQRTMLYFKRKLKSAAPLVS